MKVYADLNEDFVCVGIRMVNDDAAVGTGVEIESYNPDYLTRKFEEGIWGEKMPLQFEPGDGAGLKVPIDKIQLIEGALAANEELLDDIALAILQSDGTVVSS